MVAAEEGATQETPADDRPGYAPERRAGDDLAAMAPATATSTPAHEREPDLAAEPVVDRASYEEEPGVYDQEVDQARRPSEGG